MTPAEQAAALKLKLRRDQWWIVGHDPEIGPYDGKPEAEEARKGIERFYRIELDKK